jgi:flavin-dependent dehydrogenase
MEKHDTIIIGAGPGGLTAAKELAKKDRDVLVLERKAENRLGNRATDAILGPVSKQRNIVPASVCINTQLPELPARVFFKRGHEITEVSGELLGLKNWGITLHFPKFIEWKLNEARRFGAEVRDQSPVKKVRKRDNTVVLKNGTEIGYNYLLAADGSNSIVARSLGLPLSQTVAIQYWWDDGRYKQKTGDIYLDLGDEALVGGQGWLAPCGTVNGEVWTHINAYAYLRKRPMPIEKQRRLDEKIKKFWGSAGVDLNEKDIIKKVGLLNHSWNGFKRGNIFFLGDAACFQNILDASGIYPAIRSGEIAARAIADEKYDYKKDLKELYRSHKVAAPFAFAMSLLDVQNMERTQKPMKRVVNTLRWMEDHKWGYRFLSRTNHFVATKLLKRFPGWSAFLYIITLSVPMTMNTFETTKAFKEVIWDENH